MGKAVHWGRIVDGAGVRREPENGEGLISCILKGKLAICSVTIFLERLNQK
jgi:hypothetical protein